MREIVETMEVLLPYLFWGSMIATVGGIVYTLKENYRNPVVSKMYILRYKDGTHRDSSGREVRVEYVKPEEDEGRDR